MVGWDALYKPAALTMWQEARKAMKGGVPDEMPFNLTAKYAIRQAMQNSLAPADRINDRVGLQDVTGGNAGSQPIYSATEVAKVVQKRKLGMGVGAPSAANVGMNNG